MMSVARASFRASPGRDQPVRPPSRTTAGGGSAHRAPSGAHSRRSNYSEGNVAHMDTLDGGCTIAPISAVVGKPGAGRGHREIRVPAGVSGPAASDRRRP